MRILEYPYPLQLRNFLGRTREPLFTNILSFPYNLSIGGN